MVVRFRAGAANFLFKFPLTELADSVVEMDTIWGSNFLHLREHLLEQPTPEAKITALESWLFQRLRPESAPHPVVGYALERIHQSPQLLTIADIKHSQQAFLCGRPNLPANHQFHGYWRNEKAKNQLE